MKRNLILSLIAVISFYSYVNAENNINTQAIDTTEVVAIANTKQVIRVKGSDLQKPILLYLNGGPGDSVLSLMDKMFGELQSEFIVVLWDQRNTGQTATLNDENIQITQELFKNDTYLLIKYLLKKFNKKKLVLAGHSYGTTLGFDIARKHPEILHGYIAINPLTNQVESERMTLAMLREYAKNKKNTKATNELSKVVIPFETAEALYYARKWLFDFEGKSFAKKKSFKKRVNSWSSNWLALFNESIQENLFESTTKIDCPVYFIIGQKDYQANFKLTKKYFSLLEAPKKDIFSIEDAGHLIPYENGIKFQNLIIENVLPTIKINKD